MEYDIIHAVQRVAVEREGGVEDEVQGFTLAHAFLASSQQFQFGAFVPTAYLRPNFSVARLGVSPDG
jgi:hypothetical protein